MIGTSSRLILEVFYELQRCADDGCDDPADLFNRVLLAVSLSSEVAVPGRVWSQLEESIRRAIECRPMTPALFGGLSGLLFATAVASKYCGQMRQLFCDMQTLIPELVHYAEHSKRANCDLISGSAGIVVALLECPRVSPLNLDEIAASLISNAARQDGSLLWKLNELERKGLMGQDIGLAHGVPGLMIAVHRLSSAVSPAARSSCVEFIRLGLKWLVNQKNGDGFQATFPYFTDSPGESRLAWCYGDLSTGFALMHLGQEYGVSDALATGIAAIESASEKSISASMISDPFLCHGYAGVVRVLQEASLIFASSRIEASTRKWASYLDCEVQRFLDSGERPTLSFLDGWGGVAMHLICEKSPSNKYWLRPLMLSSQLV